MSSVALQGNASGTGAFVIASPVSNVSRTLTLPDVTGTMFVAGAATAITAMNAVASTSGTAIDFTGIPSWVKRITVLFNGVSTSGTAYKLVQIGSGSVTTTGYTSAGATIASNVGYSANSSTAGFIVNSADAGDNLLGSMTIHLLGSNIYVSSHSMGDTAGTYVNGFMGGGTVTLSGAIDRVRITTSNGTDTFDAGSINVLYE